MPPVPPVVFGAPPPTANPRGRRAVYARSMPPQSYVKRKPAAYGLMGASVFGPQAGPPDVTGGGGDYQPLINSGPAPDGYGDMPYGDGIGIDQGYNEDPRLVGIVVKLSTYTWLAFRTQTWGGTQFMGNHFKDARSFLEGATGRILREEPFVMPDGTHAFKYWNDAYTGPGLDGRGYGD